MRRITQLAAKLTKEELLNKAQERFNALIRMYGDSNVTAEQMYEDMTCSIFTGDMTYDSKPVLDQCLCFKYKGYDFELTSCNCITRKEQIIGLTDKNFLERFPNGIFTDRYVCWMQGHKDIIGRTKEELNDPEDWAPMIYLVPGAWAYGAEYGLLPGSRVTQCIIEAIDKFLETFKE